MEAKLFNLDKIDRKIISALEENSRQPNKAIARKVKASEHVVAYRIGRMLDEGIIKKIYCVINRGALFPVGFRTFLRFQSLSSEKESELVKRLEECKYTNWIGRCRGRWDLVFSMFTNDPNHFMALYNEITSGFEDFILEKEIVCYLELSDFNRAYLHESQPVEMKEYEGKISKADVDGLDMKILEQLSENSRLALIEMAKKIGTSPDTIRNRINRLEKEKVILGHGVQLGLRETGLSEQLVLLSMRNFSKKRENALHNFAVQHPNVAFWIKFIGIYDVCLELEIEEQKLDEFVAELRNKFGDLIKNIEVLTVTKDFKYTYLTQK